MEQNGWVDNNFLCIFHKGGMRKTLKWSKQGTERRRKGKENKH